MENKSLMTCPNEKCSCNKEAEGRWFIRKGSFIHLSGKLVHRFQCKACGVNFSESTFMDTYRQHKPEVNEQVFNWYTDSASQRQIARNLEIARVTVVRKFRFLSEKARRIHACYIATGKLSTNQVQFDEQETYIRYVCRTVLHNVRLACRFSSILIATDAKPAYRTYVRQMLPKAIHLQVNRSDEDREVVSKSSEHDLWWVNQCCSVTRHYLSRLRRRTCVTSKDIDELRRHLWLFAAKRNGYAADLFNPLFDLTVFRNIQQTVVAITDDLRQGLVA